MVVRAFLMNQKGEAIMGGYGIERSPGASWDTPSVGYIEWIRFLLDKQKDTRAYARLYGLESQVQELSMCEIPAEWEEQVERIGWLCRLPVCFLCEKLNCECGAEMDELAMTGMLPEVAA